jgi:hypothetical protein
VHEVVHRLLDRGDIPERDHRLSRHCRHQHDPATAGQRRVPATDSPDQRHQVDRSAGQRRLSRLEARRDAEVVHQRHHVVDLLHRRPQLRPHPLSARARLRSAMRATDSRIVESREKNSKQTIAGRQLQFLSKETVIPGRRLRPPWSEPARPCPIDRVRAKGGAVEYRLATHSPAALANHVITHDRLVIIDEAKNRRDEVLFADIRTITLQQTLGAYVTRITRGSGRPIMIRSRYVAPAFKIEDRVAEYAELVTMLHEAVVAEKLAIQFVGGSTQFYWVGWIVLTISAVFASLLVWAMLAGQTPPPRLLSLCLVVSLGFIGGAAAIRQGRATPYDPRAPAAKLLPLTRRAPACADSRDRF